MMNSSRYQGPLKFDLLDENVGDDTPNISVLDPPMGNHLDDDIQQLPNAGNINKGLTIKDQERIIDELRKENYGLKMRIYFLEDRMNKMTPAHMNEALREVCASHHHVS
jgi:hypothetical protein